MRDAGVSLGKIVESFFRDSLARQRRASPQTVTSYRDALKLFLVFAAAAKGVPPSSLKVADLDADMVLAFLNDLEVTRKNSVQTRNVRRTALRSFFKHVAYEDPTALGIVERALMVPAKRCDQTPIDFLRPDEQEALLASPNRATPQGRRDHALLLFLLRTGARESESIAVDLQHLRLATPRQVLLYGKGRKERIVPICDLTASAINAALADRGPCADNAPVFVNRDGARLSRHGVIHMVKRHALRGAKAIPTLGTRAVAPHLLRHTCAMNLLRAGVDLTTIRAWLGHVSVQTTHAYVRSRRRDEAKGSREVPHHSGRGHTVRCAGPADRPAGEHLKCCAASSAVAPFLDLIPAA